MVTHQTPKSLSLTPELEARLMEITCQDYAPLIVSLAKTIENAETIINFMEIGYYKGGLNTLVWKPPQPIKIGKES